MLKAHHDVKRVILGMRAERLHVAPGKSYDVRAKLAYPPTKRAGSLSRRNKRQIKQILFYLWALLVNIVSDIKNAARVYFPTG